MAKMQTRSPSHSATGSGTSIRFLKTICVMCLFSSFGVGVSAYKVTLEQVLNGELAASYFTGQWTSDIELQYTTTGLDILAYNVTSGTLRTVINSTVFPQFPGRQLKFSADGLFILIEHSWKPAYEAVIAKCELYDVRRGVLYNLAPTNHPGPQPELQLVVWSPVGSALAFVYNSNIYYRPNAEQATPSHQVTTDGSKVVSNGQVVWVFAEDIFGTGKGMGFSPDGAYLGFIRFDETDVGIYKYQKYGEPGDTQNAYPEVVGFPFPKVGTQNPKTQVFYVNLGSSGLERLPINYPTSVPLENLHYVATASWRTPRDLVIVQMNRRQNISTWLTCNVSLPGQPCKEIWVESESVGWIDMNTIHSSNSTGTFFTLSSARTPEALKSFQHIVRISDGFGVEHIRPMLGTFNIHVESIIGWDEVNRKIYFDGNTEADKSEQHIFSISDNPSAIDPELTCITCTMENSNKQLCRANRVIFSKYFTNFLHGCMGPDIPEVALRTIAEPNKLGRIWEDNQNLRDKMKDAEMPEMREFMNIPLSGGDSGRARLFLPPNFDESKKYPLLIDVYAGPNTKMIAYDFGIGWGTSLVSDKEIIYGHIDGRTARGGSKENLYLMNNRMGTIEVEDQISITRWLIENNVYIDSDKTAIWGWSNGGFVAATALRRDTEDVFKCGIAFAPVSTWLYHATVSAEKYMGFPTTEDNLDNYLDQDLNTHVENFRNKEFLLVHGTADVNAQFQQSMLFSRALQKARITFSEMIYSDETHMLMSSPAVNFHFFLTLEKFLFRDCYGKNGGEPPIVGTTQPAIAIPSTESGSAGSSPVSNPSTLLTTYVLVVLTIFLSNYH